MMIGILEMDAVRRVAQKSAHMMDIDPGGWTLTLVSVCVVFGALLILYMAYSLIGEIMMRRPSNGSSDDYDSLESAAIAAALHCYLAEEDEEDVHDKESGVITITKQ